MNKNFHIVIMAGGSGTRLWPISRSEKPKQFHNFCHTSKSLLQETYERLESLVPNENIYVSLVRDILEVTQKQLPEIKKDNFVIEPEGKNTGPAVALATTTIFRQNPEAIIAIISSDHTIIKVKEFQKTLLDSKNFLKKNGDFLVTIGIKPERPHTGYGYIKVGRKFPKFNIYEALKFVEKPDLKTAETYLKSGQYFWNAGYFIFRAQNMLKLYKIHAPKIYRLIQKMFLKQGGETQNNLQKLFHQMPNIPVDIAIAEKVEKLACLPADLGWSDVGSWASLYDLLATKRNGGVVSRGAHLGIGDRNCLIYAQDKLLATVGLQDIIIVDTPDVTLVCHKDKAQDVKKLIEKLKEEGKTHYL